MLQRDWDFSLCSCTAGHCSAWCSVGLFLLHVIHHGSLLARPSTHTTQHAPLPNLLPTRPPAFPRKHIPQPPHLERSCARARPLPRLLHPCLPWLHHLHLRPALPHACMGKLSRSSRHHTCRYTIHSPNHDDLEVAGDGQLERAHDVHTDARQFCLCGKSGSEAWAWGLECLGIVHLDRLFARLSPWAEFVVHLAGQARAEED